MEDNLRLFSANLGALSFQSTDNYKVVRLKHIAKKYDVDGMRFQEPCVNWPEVKSTRSLADLLWIGAEDIRVSAAHNRLEDKKTGIKQQGRRQHYSATSWQDSPGARALITQGLADGHG